MTMQWNAWIRHGRSTLTAWKGQWDFRTSRWLRSWSPGTLHTWWKPQAGCMGDSVHSGSRSWGSILTVRSPSCRSRSSVGAPATPSTRPWRVAMMDLPTEGSRLRWDRLRGGWGCSWRPRSWSCRTGLGWHVGLEKRDFGCSCRRLECLQNLWFLWGSAWWWRPSAGTNRVHWQLLSSQWFSWAQVPTWRMAGCFEMDEKFNMHVQWCAQQRQGRRRWWSSMMLPPEGWRGNSLPIWKIGRFLNLFNMMIYLNFCEKTWLWMTPMMFGGRLESQIWGRTCSAWAILLMSSLVNFLEINIKMEAKVEVWMLNLPYVQCGQGGSPTPLQRLQRRLWGLQTRQLPPQQPQLQGHWKNVMVVDFCSRKPKTATFVVKLWDRVPLHSRA